MILVEERSTPPHLLVTLEGYITLADLDEVLQTFERSLGCQHPGFLIAFHNLRLTGFETPALGVLFYLTNLVFRARPGIVIFINSGRFVSPHLEQLINRLGTPETLRICATTEEAHAFLEAYCSSTV